MPEVGVACDGLVTRGGVDGIEETGAAAAGGFVFFGGVELRAAAGCDLFSLGHGLGGAFVFLFIRVLADIVSAECDGIDQSDVWRRGDCFVKSGKEGGGLIYSA